MPSPAFTQAVQDSLSQFYAGAQQDRDQAAAEAAALIAAKKMLLGTQVAQAFVDLIGRGPTALEKAEWTEIVYLTGASTVRDWAAAQAGIDLRVAQLAQASAADAQSVEQAFMLYLLRPPTENEASFWTEQTTASQSVTPLLQHLAADPMVAERFAIGGGSRTEAVQKAFESLFGRNASPAEILTWADSGNHELPWQLFKTSMNGGAGSHDAVVLNNRLEVAGEIQQKYGANEDIGLATLRIALNEAVSATGASKQSMVDALKHADQMLAADTDVTASKADTTAPAEAAVIRNDGVLILSFTESIDWDAMDVNGNGRVDFSELQISAPGIDGTFGSRAYVVTASADRLAIACGPDANVDGPIFLAGVKDLAGNIADVIFI